MVRFSINILVLVKVKNLGTYCSYTGMLGNGRTGLECSHVGKLVTFKLSIFNNQFVQTTNLTHL